MEFGEYSCTSFRNNSEKFELVRNEFQSETFATLFDPLAGRHEKVNFKNGTKKFFL